MPQKYNIRVPVDWIQHDSPFSSVHLPGASVFFSQNRCTFGLNVQDLVHKKFRVTIIGVGRMGAHHARVLSSHPGFDLVGLYDQNLMHAQEMAQQFGAAAFLSEEEVWQSSEVVTITCPTSAHAYWIAKSMEKGVPFLVEKPATHDAETCTLLMKETPSDFPAMVGHIERFNPAVLAAGDLPLQARIFECNRHAPFTSRGADVSVVMDLMIHDLDLLWSWKPEWPSGITASGTTSVGVGPDHVVAHLQYADGVTACLSASRLSDIRQREICCTGHGWQVRMDLAKGEVFQTLSHGGEPQIHRLPVAETNALILEYDAWHHALLHQTAPPCSLAHASKVMLLAETINRLASL